MRAAEPAREPRWRRYALRAVGIGLLALTAWLVVDIARETDWNAVLAALRSRSAGALAAIAGIALASHALYGMLDVLGARSLGLKLPRRRVWLTATSSYACNLNLGSLVGAAALRYKLYCSQGVAVADVSRMIALSMAANWLGYLVLLASLPLWVPPLVMTRWIGDGGAIALSGGAALAVTFYLAACLRQTQWRIRGHEFRFPAIGLAVTQIAVGATNWALMGLVLRLALGDGAGYGETLASLLVAAIAGAVTHVPGGWGVLDYVILKSLSGSLDPHRVVAGVLVYRAAYYLLPLALAPLSITWLLRRGKSRRVTAKAQAA
ncbi:MAG TPA: YbhN family protein [Tahibacter sp.]|uniref:lysylphosphatidylglycerol synthase transmembrane domain-containing protein n=1 Tax=Tahibacter sp. TaxID=2056211 RepID=UPI002B70FF01|nr:YbhN family protein [Tahibacter sp.]HSX62512.1 YbhN family protein [Tahibacter sp.]